MRDKTIAIISRARNLLKAAAVAVFVFSANAALAVDTGLNSTAERGGYNTAANTDLSLFIGRIIAQVMGFVGVIFFVLMIYGGFLWMTAQGNEEQIKKAKSLITGAIIGIVIVFSAYAITAFVVNQATEATNPGTAPAALLGGASFG